MKRARVARVVAAGRRVADAEDRIGRAARLELLATSGLSSEGVELALTRHLETNPSEADLDALVARAGTAPRCHIVLSGHVCVGALRAIAVASATSPEVMVRPSRRDPVLARLLAEALAADASFAQAGGSVRVVDEVDAAAGDELHLYGSDEATGAIASRAAPGVLVRAHGTGLGVAVIGDQDDLAGSAEALASDVAPFDQRGCLSPRFALVDGDAARALAFARALHLSLSRLDGAVPRGPLDAAARGEIVRYVEAMLAVGESLTGAGHGVGVDPEPRALLLPPAARVVHVVPARDARLLAPWARFVTVVGARGDGLDAEGALARAVMAITPSARRARLGWMQRPPLDGPVDLRQKTIAP